MTHIGEPIRDANLSADGPTAPIAYTRTTVSPKVVCILLAPTRSASRPAAGTKVSSAHPAAIAGHISNASGEDAKGKRGALVKSIARKLTGTGDNERTRDVTPFVDMFAVRGSGPAGEFQAAGVSKTGKEAHTARWVHVLLVMAECG